MLFITRALMKLLRIGMPVLHTFFLLLSVFAFSAVMFLLVVPSLHVTAQFACSSSLLGLIAYVVRSCNLAINGRSA